MNQQPGSDKIRTRQQILNLLKQQGAFDSTQLAAQLGVSAMAVRQHLYELQAQGMVTYQEQVGGVGRPAKQWQLTSAADSFFPTGYAELTVNLLHALREAFGDEGLDKLLAIRMQQQIGVYQARLNAADPLAQRLEMLAQQRSEEGYMATVITTPAGELLLVENHCPICDAAKHCMQLCNRELETFQTVLGDDVIIERVEHILAGSRRCAYRVIPKAVN
ncbi:MAG: transcriptional regulator [Chloroflexi bacterium]|nr:transcriptional regulator [Chloroflexota bacterium]